MGMQVSNAGDRLTKKRIEVLTAEMQAGWDLIDQAFELLHQASFTPGFLANFHTECVKAHLEACDPHRKFRRYAYLAFFGDGQQATYMKVGISKDPNERFKGLTTGNPLKLMWCFACDLANTAVALRVEKAVLHHFKEQRAQGEWVSIGPASYEAATQLVLRAKGVAEVAAGHAVTYFEIDQ
jgi:hypothetical protein